MFVTTGRVGEFLCGDHEKKLFLKIMNAQGFDTVDVEGVGVDGICPDDGAGVDRTIDQEILGNFASEKSNSVFITPLLQMGRFCDYLLPGEWRSGWSGR